MGKLEELIADVLAPGLAIAQSLHARHGGKIGIYFISYTEPEITLFVREPIAVEEFPSYTIRVEPIAAASGRYQQCRETGNIGAWLAFVPSDEYALLKEVKGDC